MNRVRGKTGGLYREVTILLVVATIAIVFVANSNAKVSGCRSNDDCQGFIINPTGFPICDEGECVQCTTDEHCTMFGNGSFCNNERCDDCRDLTNVISPDCPDSNSPICTNFGRCVQCVSDSDCGDLACDTQSNTCFCDEDHPCPSGQVCQSGGCMEEPQSLQTFFNRDPFLAALNGEPITTIGFDDLEAGTNITALSIEGIEFDRLKTGCPGASYGTSTYRCGLQTSSPLIIINSIPGLPATSGGQLLSPGGPNITSCNDPTTENDDLLLIFRVPVKAFGIDIVFKSLDVSSVLGIRILGIGGDTLFESRSLSIPNLGFGHPGSQFVGIISPHSNIAVVEIDEYDEDCVNPDEHVGYDRIIAVP